LGRLLVHGLVELAIEHGMSVATLEVRESNEAARALYREYGFYEVGERKRYYSDNRENAVIMTTEELRSPAYQRRLEGLATELRRRFPGIEFGDLSDE
jgi:ribosomal-protein-alanine N-acetyltransferase